MRRRKPLPELPRIYVQPKLDRRQREACRDWFVATCSGEKKHPDTVDPLWMRLGLRASLIRQRAGWVISNPVYSDSLDRHPENDPSLPGPGWLREVYRWHDGRTLCVLRGVRALIEGRLCARRRAEEVQQHQTRNQPEKTAQAELFEPDDSEDWDAGHWTGQLLAWAEPQGPESR